MTNISPLNESLAALDTLSLSGTRTTFDTRKLATTKPYLDDILKRYLAEQKISAGERKVGDGFYFIFDNAFADGWQDNDWWDQREILKTMQTNEFYKERTVALLKLSTYSDYYTYKVSSIPDQDNHREQYASRRERLHLKEGYENVIDALSSAAYCQQKYMDMYPALLQLLFTDGKSETIIIVDNGIGRQFHKPYRRIAPWRVLFKAYKLIMNQGAYYIGGMHLGLKVTYGRLSCFGDGAVVHQAPFESIY